MKILHPTFLLFTVLVVYCANGQALEKNLPPKVVHIPFKATAQPDRIIMTQTSYLLITFGKLVG